MSKINMGRIMIHLLLILVAWISLNSKDVFGQKLDMMTFDSPYGTVIIYEKVWEIGDMIEPEPIRTGSLDCEDAALFTYLYLTYKGYDVEGMFGSLSKGSSYDHVWVLAEGEYAYDAGYCIFDDRYKDGVKLTYKHLLQEALRDCE